MDAVTSVPDLSPPGLWASIREALRGSHQDYTTGNLNRAISVAGDSDGARDGARVAVRCGGCLLGWAAWARTLLLRSG